MVVVRWMVFQALILVLDFVIIKIGVCLDPLHLFPSQEGDSRGDIAFQSDHLLSLSIACNDVAEYFIVYI